eukprot:Gregarina_sp_Pseudo_9__3648@NODE_37_length_5345_cov_13_452130_g34_i0_p1_GENE_NODE_37_length_5345_cov_13_452130_g34_i0NODE_37_length_5345_cov_13_452130_g34_i0_p1_ORF_typecomplete_len849_score299_40CRAL_TRIO/PF00650_20/1_3CRAL_TRIO/PF00650_20/1_1e14_NODE_37_length_5345_cov_13_452130_g34_i02932548
MSVKVTTKDVPSSSLLQKPSGEEFGGSAAGSTETASPVGETASPVDDLSEHSQGSQGSRFSSSGVGTVISKEKSETFAARESVALPEFVPRGVCDRHLFDGLGSLAETPTFPLYAEEHLRILKALKPAAVVPPDGKRAAFSGVPITEVECAMLDNLEAYIRSLQDFSLAQAMTEASPPLVELLQKVRAWGAETAETETEMAEVSGVPLWDSLFAPTRGEFYSGMALRFLVFNNMAVEDTVAHMLAVRYWLSTRGFLALSRSELAPFLQTGGFYIAGHDRLCRPMLVCRFDRLARLASELSPLSAERKQDLLTLHGAYWFLFFRQYLAVAVSVEQMAMLVDLGDVRDDDPELAAVVGPVLATLLYLFPLYVESVCIVDSSNRRDPMQSVDLVLRHLDPANNKASLKSLRLKCLPIQPHLDGLHHDIDVSQRETLYGGTQPRVSVFDLPVAFIPEGVSPAGSSKSGGYSVGPVCVHGALRPTQLGSRPPVALRSFAPSALAGFLARATRCAGDTPSLSKKDRAGAHSVWTALTSSNTLSQHGTCHNAIEVLRALRRNNFDCDRSVQDLATRLAERSRALCRPPCVPSVDSPCVDAVYWHGRDRRMRPVLVVRLALLTRDPAETALSVLDFWLHFGSEFLLIPGLVDTWTIIADLDGVSSVKLAGLRPYVARFTNNFPERLAQMFVFNAGFLARRACEQLLFRSPKVEFVAQGSFKDQMAEFISATQVEKRFGGNAKDVQQKGRLRAFFPSLRK